jgi:hypothetical protein
MCREVVLVHVLSQILVKWAIMRGAMHDETHMNALNRSA